MFVEWSFTKHVLFVQIVVMATKRASLRKKKRKKSTPQKLYVDEAETLQKGS